MVLGLLLGHLQNITAPKIIKDFINWNVRGRLASRYFMLSQASSPFFKRFSSLAFVVAGQRLC